LVPGHHRSRSGPARTRVGAALLRSRLRRCDQEGLPAYIESSNPKNVALCQHFGFRATGTLGLPEDAPVVSTMWRPGGARDGDWIG